MKTLGQINRGGFGIVDKVELPSGEIVARKTFDPAIPISAPEERDKLLKRFKREVKFQSSFNADSICPILESDLECDDPWFTMPLADRTLQDEIPQYKSGAASANEPLADVLNALQELHQLGFVHRDLKPQNILLIDGIWKLTDFGLILPPSGMTAKLTSKESNWGTPEYAAPEQSSQFHLVQAAADIYAFGCILHDIFCTPPRIPYARHSGPGKIGLIIERCTELKPEKRFVSISALRGALLSVLSTPASIVKSASANEWVEAILKDEIDNSEKLEELVRYLRLEAGHDDQYYIFKSIDESHSVLFHGLNIDLWKLLVLEYCEWVARSGFDFTYCDVVADLMAGMYTLGDIETRAAIALSAAELGKSHNRWFVMGHVIKMCSPEIDEQIATRISIDIRAFECQGSFRRCADGLSRNYDAYHPLIRDTITKSADNLEDSEIDF